MLIYMNLETGGTVRQTGSDVMISGKQYPKQVMMDKAFMLSLGFKPYREVKVDDRYYWQGTLVKADNGTEVVGTYEAIPRLVEDRLEFEEDGITPLLDEDGVQVVTKGMKSNMIAKVKQNQANQLAEIDWYWLREMKTAIPVPTDIQTLATNIYSEASTEEALINALVTIEDIIAYDISKQPIDPLV